MHDFGGKVTDHVQEQRLEDSAPRAESPPEPARTKLERARQHIAPLQAADREHESIERALRERVKELNCLYSISHLVDRPGISLKDILQGTVDLIPAAWPYPQITAARMVLEGQDYRTENWTDNVTGRQVVEITVHGQPSGSIEVCSLKDRPESDKGPFLNKEKSLLSAIAERLGRIVERLRAEQALRRAHDELEQRIQERTAELEQGHQRERVINALLRLSMEETSLDEQLERALDQILSIPWLPVLRRGAVFVIDEPGGELRLRAQRGLEPELQAACAQVRPGHCLCGRAAAEGEIEFADRVDERHEIIYEGMPPHGHYCVPILSSRASNLDQGGAVGTIVLYLEEGHRRDAQEEAFLRAVAHTLAGMIGRGRAADALRRSEQQLRELNKRLEAYSRTLEQRVRERMHEVERRSQVAESLRDILAVLNSDRPLQEVLEYIVTEASRLLQSDASAIYRLQQHDASFEVQAATGRSAQWAETTGLAPQLIQALRDGQPVAFSGFSVEEREDALAGISQPLPPGCLVQGCQATLAVPLAIADEVYGALVLYYEQPRAFAEDEVELAVAFADQAALAIENARLHQHAREAANVHERARLARELHDSVTQSLYSLTLLAEGWRRLDAAGRLGDKDAPLKELGDLAQQALKEMRLMVYELRPPTLEQEGLLGALHQRLGAVEQRAGVEARLLAQEIVELPEPVEEGLYRIAIEALNNALKHASATTVTVRLGADGGWVTLEVVDNGLGFDPQSVRDSPGMGLHTMRERAKELGGALIVHSVPGRGASVVARVPFEE